MALQLGALREARLMWRGATVAAIMRTDKRAGLQ
jgi:hypothetical protein